MVDFPVPIAQKNSNEDKDYRPPVSYLDLHLCYVYSGITIDKLLDMDVYNFRLLLINAFINEAYKTEEGKQMVDDYNRVYVHGQECDIEGLMSIFS